MRGAPVHSSEADECACDSCYAGSASVPRLVVPQGAISEPLGGFKPGGVEIHPVKHDAGKIRMELLPPEFIVGVSAVLTFGATKYSAGNWAVGEGFHWSRLFGACLRHLWAWARGEDLDPESGLNHLYHAGCMIAFLAAHVERRKGKDDRKEIGVAA